MSHMAKAGGAQCEEGVNQIPSAFILLWVWTKNINFLSGKPRNPVLREVAGEEGAYQYNKIKLEKAKSLYYNKYNKIPRSPFLTG